MAWRICFRLYFSGLTSCDGAYDFNGKVSRTIPKFIYTSIYGRKVMYRGNKYYEALKLKYLGEIAEAEAVLNTYFTNSVGIGEHSELLPEFDKWLGKLAEAKDKLNALEGLL